MNAVAPGLAAFPHRLANANAADTTFGDLTFGKPIGQFSLGRAM